TGGGIGVLLDRQARRGVADEQRAEPAVRHPGVLHLIEHLGDRGGDRAGDFVQSGSADRQIERPDHFFVSGRQALQPPCTPAVRALPVAGSAGPGGARSTHPFGSSVVNGVPFSCRGRPRTSTTPSRSISTEVRPESSTW